MAPEWQLWIIPNQLSKTPGAVEELHPAHQQQNHQDQKN
jgi:hypothetical protein